MIEQFEFNDRQVCEYIRANMGSMPRSRLAREAGISLSKLYRILRKDPTVSLRKRNGRRSQWVDNYIKLHYADEPSQAIAEHVSLSVSYVKRIAWKMGVHKSEEYIRRLRNDEMVRLSSGEMLKKRNERIKATRRMDEIRELSGLSPIHNYRKRSMTRRAYASSWSLIKNYGYERDASDPYTMHFRNCARRVKEGYYNKKYGLKFID